MTTPAGANATRRAIALTPSFVAAPISAPSLVAVDCPPLRCGESPANRHGNDVALVVKDVTAHWSGQPELTLQSLPPCPQ